MQNGRAAARVADEKKNQRKKMDRDSEQERKNQISPGT